MDTSADYSAGIHPSDVAITMSFPFSLYHCLNCQSEFLQAADSPFQRRSAYTVWHGTEPKRRRSGDTL